MAPKWIVCKACNWSSHNRDNGQQQKCGNCSKLLPMQRSKSQPAVRDGQWRRKSDQQRGGKRANSQRARGSLDIEQQDLKPPKQQQNRKSEVQELSDAEETPQPSTKQDEIKRLIGLQKALLLPQDQDYFDAIEKQVTILKTEINQSKPLDEQIKGLDAAIIRSQAKRSQLLDGIADQQLQLGVVEAKLEEQTKQMEQLKVQKLQQLNVKPQQQDIATQQTMTQLMGQVTQLQNILNQLATTPGLPDQWKQQLASVAGVTTPVEPKPAAASGVVPPVDPMAGAQSGGMPPSSSSPLPPPPQSSAEEAARVKAQEEAATLLREAQHTREASRSPRGKIGAQTGPQ